jgi:hypothetical protein
MRPVETILIMGEGGDKREWYRVNSIMIYCKNFCKYHVVPPEQQ